MSKNSKKRKIVANIPVDLLDQATKISGMNQTAAIIEGLRELIKTFKINKLISLKGKLDIEYNPKVTRSRS